MRGWASLADCIQSLQSLNSEDMVMASHETIPDEERAVPESVH